MNKIWLIIQREYITRVKKKSFIITTLLVPIGLALFIGVIGLIAKVTQDEKRIAVVDDTGRFKNKLKDSKTMYFKFTSDPIDSLEKNFKKENYDGILMIPEQKSFSTPKGVIYKSDKSLGVNAQRYMEGELKAAIRNIKIEDSRYNKAELKELDKVDLELKVQVFGEDGEKDAYGAIAMGIGYAMGFIIYITMFIYGTMVMRGVMEEKTNRIIEVIASSVKPIQLMMGKIIGIGAVGLTQFLLWGILMSGVYFGAFAIFGADLANNMQDMPGAGTQPEIDENQAQAIFEQLGSFSWGKIFMYFIFYFLGGYLLYGSLFAAIGSAVNEEGEGQALNMIVSLPIITAIIIMTIAVQEPESGLAVWGSIIPFTSPIVILARIPFEPAAWQIGVSMILLILGFIFTTWVAAKIYRVGILMRGKKVNLKELARWMRYS